MYYSLLFLDDDGRWGMEFGDHAREVVEEEREAMRDSSRYADKPPMGLPRYNSMRRYKILRHRNARQSTINAQIEEINKDHTEGTTT